MRKLRKNIGLLLITIAIFYNIERLNFGNENFIDISTFVYVLQLGAVLTTVLVPVLVRTSFSVLLLGWFAAYFVGKFILSPERPIVGGMHSYVLITEVVFLFLSISLAYDLATRLQDFEEAVENITFANLRDRILSKEKAMESVQTEIQRSRRHEHTMGVALIEPNPDSINAVMHRTVQEVQTAMMGRYVALGLANVITKQCRRTDLVIDHDNKGRFVVICPETSPEGVKRLIERVRVAAKNQLGLSLFAGVAVFPQHALTYKDLVNYAEEHLQTDPSLQDSSQLANTSDISTS
jgi:GGDEF domain-containing protein